MNSFFKISERGSTIGREIRGGVVTFFTMAYIIVLSPLILSGADVHGNFLGGSSDPGKNIAAIAAGTALVAGVMSILMGLIGNFPLSIAAGLGLSAFVSVTMINEVTWADAMGLIVIEGIIIVILAVTGFRTAIFRAVPAPLKVAISVGIGLFIALIGLVDAGFVRRMPDAAHSTVPVQLGPGGELQGWPTLIFILGLALMVILWVRKVKGAILIAIIVTTIGAIIAEQIGKFGSGAASATGWSLNVPKWPDKIVDTPHFDTMFHFSLFGSFETAGAVTAILFIFTLVLADFFDLMGTMTAVGAGAGILDDEGMPPRTRSIMAVDGLAAVAGGIGGASSNTGFIESAAGVGEGARTGLASVVTGILFLAATVLAPLVNVVPSEAAVPALVLVGFLMMKQVKDIDWEDIDIAIPAFLTIALMPFTYSITVGIGAGFVSYALIKIVRGKAKEVHPLLWAVAILFIVYFAINPITSWLT